MAVSHPQRLTLQSVVTDIYSASFAVEKDEAVTLEEIRGSNIHELVEVSQRARWQDMHDANYWWAIQEGFERGMVFHKLSPQELIKIKWAFCGAKKFGTPQFHAVLADILREDVPHMSR